MTMPLVSVIIPVYNVEKYLRECMDSVLNQTLKDIEVICVDDGSTDGSLDFLREYESKDSRVKVYTQNNKFAGVARNNGFSHATGKYCIFLDSDDRFDKNLLRKTYKKAEKDQADIVAFNFDRFDEFGKVEKRIGIHTELLPKNKAVFSYKDCPEYIMSVVNPTPWTKLYRTSFIAENNLKYEEISTTNDITFASVSVAVAKRISYLKDYLVHYRIGQSDTISSNKPKKLGNTLIAVKSAINQASQLPYYEEIRDGVMRFTVENISYALKNNIPDLRDPVAEQFYKDAKDLFSTPLFKDCTAERLHSPTLFDWYLFVCTFDYEELMNLFVLNFKNTDIHKMLLEKNSNYVANDELVQRKKQDRQIIVSLTSFPERIGTVHLTINTLLNQSLRPDKLILWLAEKEFPNREEDLPEELLELKKQGLEICWCENIMSYKKIIPALRMYPDALIVTADDDLYYHPKWLEILYRSYLNNPHCIPCHRVTKILMAEDNTYSAIVGGREYWEGPSYLNKLGSGSGTLFSPGCFHPDVLDETKFKELAPTNDDIWLWLMGALAGYKVIVPEDAMIGLHYIDGTQESALWQINNRGDELFWTQFYNILNAYPELKQLLSDEYVKVSSAEKAKKEMIEAQKRTFSYRARRVVTWIPRKAKGGIRCIQENGWRYTFNRVLIHLHLKKPPKKEAVQVWNSSQKESDSKKDG